MYELTPSEFANYMAGQAHQEYMALDKLRLIVASMHNFSGYAKKHMKPEDVMRLPFDKKNKKIKVPTSAEILKGWQPRKPLG